MVTAAMKLKDTYSLEEKFDQTRQHIQKQRHYFANKGPSNQGYCFSSSHVQPTPVFLPGKSHGKRHLVGCSLWGRKELDTTEQMSTHACNKLLQSELLKTTEIFPLTGLEIKCVKSGC